MDGAAIILSGAAMFTRDADFPIRTFCCGSRQETIGFLIGYKEKKGALVRVFTQVVSNCRNQINSLGHVMGLRQSMENFLEIHHSK